jgi:hypothetical protein
MRLLSLDLDGVLHRRAVSLAPHARFEWLPHLTRLIEPWPDVRLGVHSTWRYDHTPAELGQLLGPLQHRYVGAAPRGPREDAILWFVHLLGNGAVRNWRVLDDAPSEFRELRSRLIVCDPNFGISAPDVQTQVRAWLERGGAT